MRLKLLWLLLPSLLLAACLSPKVNLAIPTTSADDNSVCQVWKDIGYHGSTSAHPDTPDTVLRIRANNAARDSWCGVKPQ